MLTGFDIFGFNKLFGFETLSLLPKGNPDCAFEAFAGREKLQKVKNTIHEPQAGFLKFLAAHASYAKRNSWILFGAAQDYRILAKIKDRPARIDLVAKIPGTGYNRPVSMRAYSTISHASSASVHELCATRIHPFPSR